MKTSEMVKFGNKVISVAGISNIVCVPIPEKDLKDYDSASGIHIVSKKDKNTPLITIISTDLVLSTISKTKMTVPGYSATIDVYYPGSYLEPPETDVVDIASDYSFERVISESILHIVRYRISELFEYLGEEKMAKEMADW